MGTTISLSSNSLFHFTDKAENLIDILIEGFKPRFCLEQFGTNDILFGTKTKDLMENIDWEEAIPMTCFCDIPISHIASHLDFYGSYGIGLSKSWGIKNGLTPVTYVHENSVQLKYIHEMANNIWELNKNVTDVKKRNHTLNIIFELSGFFKPYEGRIWRTHKYENKKFYDEREWRYVPCINPEISIEISEDYRLSKKEFLNDIKRAKANNYLGENYRLKFDFIDIKYIIIKNNEEVIAMTEAINSNNYFNSLEKTILLTKIISTEQITEDF